MDKGDLQMEERSPHLAIDIKPESEEAPPPFTPYLPEFYLDSHGDIISHDHHLNEDDEALYRFLLDHAGTPPAYLLKIIGTHEEQKSRTVTRTVNGQTTHTVEHYTETITDFDFAIDLTSYIVHGPVFWSYPDAVPAYRGLMTRQVHAEPGAELARIDPTHEENHALKADESARVDAGVPPWQAPDGSSRAEPQASALSARQWADEYAASTKHLKEFVFEKVIYGWSPSRLSTAIASSVASTHYQGKVKSTFTLSSNKIYIRPDNRLSRVLSSTLYKVLLSIILVYPFIWLWKRFSSKGGGKWEVLGAAYGLVHLEPAGGPGNWGNSAAPQVRLEVDTVEQQRYPLLQGPRFVNTERGPYNVTGYREGEWFREWELAIKRCAAAKLRRNEPLMHSTDAPAPPGNPAEALDGYGHGVGLFGY